MCSPDGLRIASRERCHWLDCWSAQLLQFNLLSLFPCWHHRYTQDPACDPELRYPKARNRIEYFNEITGFMFWFRRAIDYPALALGGARRLPFVPERARRQVTLSVSVQLLIYLAGAVSIALGFRGVLYFWLLPALLAQPLLRALLIVEHTGCSQDGNGLTNTRTTLTSFPIPLLMWNMPIIPSTTCIRRFLFTNYRRCA
jgi:fatty acid desaturase